MPTWTGVGCPFIPGLMGKTPAKGVPADLLAAFSTGRLVILPHDNPDPDSLACAVALKYIARELLDKDAAIALGGFVGRAENRAMVRYLSIPLVPVAELDLTDPGLTIALVDTQPGRQNNSLPAGMVPSVVIDHHPAYESARGSVFTDLREGYGATSTILTEYLMDKRLEVETKLATALFYGITSETQDLGREAVESDRAACHFLYPYTNKRRLSKIENARVPREYFCGFQAAIKNASIYDTAVVSFLGELRYPDMVAEMADFLLRLEEVEWAMALGHYQGGLYVSLRTACRDVNAGRILQDVLGGEHAGGHDMIAGGRIPVGDDPEAIERAASRVRATLLASIGLSAAHPVKLVA